MASSEDDEAYWNETKNKGFNFEEDKNAGSQLFGISQAGTSRLSRQVRSVISNDAVEASLLQSENSLSSESTLGSGSNDLLFSANTSTAQSRTNDGFLISTNVSDSMIQRIINSDKALEVKPKGKLLPEEELKILRRKDQMRWQAPPFDETLRRVMLGLPFSMEAYRSRDDKIKMLDAALEQGSGDAILAVVLFLSRTLKRSHFIYLLSQRPVAVNHYASHLSTRFQLPELFNLLESLGRSREASILQFGLAMKNIENPSKRQQALNNLRNTVAPHFSTGAAEVDEPFVANAVKLLEWQIAADEKLRANTSSSGDSVIGLPALASLAHACRHHWDNSKSKNSDPLSPSALCQSLCINQRAFQWTALRTKAQERAWDSLDRLFIAKSWFPGIRLIGGASGIPMAEVATELHAHAAPEEVVVKYINLIEGIEDRITLANRLLCHTAAIDIMRSQGDRLGICKLKNRLPPASEEYMYAENALSSSSVRWKN